MQAAARRTSAKAVSEPAKPQEKVLPGAGTTALVLAKVGFGVLLVLAIRATGALAQPYKGAPELAASREEVTELVRTMRSAQQQQARAEEPTAARGGAHRYDVLG